MMGWVLFNICVVDAVLLIYLLYQEILYKSYLVILAWLSVAMCCVTGMQFFVMLLSYGSEEIPLVFDTTLILVIMQNIPLLLIGFISWVNAGIKKAKKKKNL